MLKHFRKIDIELHSKCNRKCQWCPNQTLDRCSKDEIMDKKLFIKILQDIKKNNFEQSFLPNLSLSKIITFNGFSEPLLQSNLLKEYLNIAYDILGYNIFFEINTNGDFLTKENLQGLYLNKISVMDYDCKGEEYWINKMENLGCVKIYPKTEKENLSFIHESVNLIEIVLNWPKEHKIEDRGGYLTNGIELKERHFECPEMSYFISISHNGLIMPCCHMRFDNPNHTDYIVGDLNRQTFQEILTSKKYNNLKSILQQQDSTGFPGICTYCQKIRHRTLKGSPDGYDYINPRDRIDNNINF